MGSLIGVVVVVVGIAASFLLKQAPEVREFDEFSRIPEGPFPYQDGEMIDLPEFWMGRQEVTIAQYAEFLADIADKPTTIQALRHPDQPADKTSHEPKNWDEMYAAAVRGNRFSGAPIDPNCPVIGVDWWDAFAYARWKNARLPTEQEWEKAARGRGGMIYPWGDELDYTKFNSGVDQKPKDEQKAGSVDGYQFWCPVDAISADISRYGVAGMAGNVSEWTATWDAHPDAPDTMVPIKRGASFATTEGFESTLRRAAEEPGERNFYTGFRIVSDVEPGTDPSYEPPPPVRITSMTGSGLPAARSDGEDPATKEQPKTEPDTPAMPSSADGYRWDPADGPDPFETIFATPVSG